jgi:hypothetical protein
MKFLTKCDSKLQIKKYFTYGGFNCQFLFYFSHQIATSDFHEYKRKIKKLCFISGLWPDLAKYSNGWTPLRLHKKILQRLLLLLKEFVGFVCVCVCVCVCMCVFFLFLWWIFNIFFTWKMDLDTYKFFL